MERLVAMVIFLKEIQEEKHPKLSDYLNEIWGVLDILDDTLWGLACGRKAAFPRL